MLLFLSLSACGEGGNRVAADTSLTDLKLSAGILDQVFQSGQFSYTAKVGYMQSSISVTPVTASSSVQVQVNGFPVSPGRTSQTVSLGELETKIIIQISEAGFASTYVLTVTRTAVSLIGQKAFIKAGNAGINDFFGSSVALSADTLVAGAPGESSSIVGGATSNTAAASGAAYVFTQIGNAWREQAFLKANNAEAADQFGHDIAISGDTLAVSAIGESGSATGTALDNSAPNAGAVYVFVRNGLEWTEQARLKASNAATGDKFGTSIVLSGNTLMVGAPGAAGGRGAVYVFALVANQWQEQIVLTASNADIGDQFGYSMALAENTLVVGAIGESSSAAGGAADNSAANAGAAYVFVWNGSIWLEQAQLKATNAESGDAFGVSVAVFDDTLAVGANLEDSSVSGLDNQAVNAGAVYIFTRNGLSWSQQALLKATNAEKDDEFGVSIALQGDTLIVGAQREDSSVTGSLADNSIQDAGAVYLFTRIAGQWGQRDRIKAGNADPGDEFGKSVALFGDRMLVGARFEDSQASGALSDNTVANAGTMFLYQ